MLPNHAVIFEELPWPIHSEEDYERFMALTDNGRLFESLVIDKDDRSKANGTYCYNLDDVDDSQAAE